MPRLFWLFTSVISLGIPARSAPPQRAAPAQSTLGWSIAPVSSLQKLTAKTRGKLEPFQSAPIQLRAARGEWECFQIVITAGREKLNGVRVVPTGLATHLAHFLSVENVQLFWENYVFVEKPSGNRRLKKLWWPDALIPIEHQPTRSIAAGHSEVLWCAIRVPPKTEAGQYFGALDIIANGQGRTLAVTLNVEAVDLPAPTMRANVAVYYDIVRDWYAKNLKPLNDAQFATLKKRYYEFLLDYRLNAYDIPVDWSSDEADRYLADPKVLSVRLPPLDRPDFPVAVERLKKTNTLHKAYYYWIDEPAPQRYPEVLSTTQKLHAIDARIKHCVTIHPNQSLHHAVDIWCPNIGDYFGLGYIDFKMLEAQRKRGRETWWYTMVEPKYPYPTWLLDDDASAVRVYGWMMARWNITGFVYSMAHGWGPKPLENLQSFAGTNGDGTLLYPSEIVGGTGPMPSIRLMLLRDAIEDYELLQSLDDKRKAKALQGIAEQQVVAQRSDRDEEWQGEIFRNGLWKRLRRETPSVMGEPVSLSVGKLWIGGDRGPRSKSLQQKQFLISKPNGSGDVPKRTASISTDGTIAEFAWRERSQHIKTTWMHSIENLSEGNVLWLTHDQTHLFVAVRAPASKVLSGEWVAVEIAPMNASEKWRFVVTAKGNTVVEKHTREGQFRIEGLDWKGATKATPKYFDVEMKIPLSIVGNPKQFRFNALRRVWDEKVGIHYIVRAVPDAGDARLMPFVQLAPVKVLSKGKPAPKGETVTPSTSRAKLPGNLKPKPPLRSR